MKTKIFFVVNPTSKAINKKDFELLVSKFAVNYKFKWEIYYTEGVNDGKRIHHIVQTFQPDKVMAVGGDGTVTLVAAQLIESKTELGIVPTGSANGLAFNLKLPNGIEAALSHSLKADAKPLDIIQMNDNFYCLHLSDIGINARIVKRFDDEGSKGFFGYGKQMLKELLSKKSSFSFYLEANGLRKKYRAEMVVIANARSFGTGAVINPTGRHDDGVFEIIIIKPYPWWILVHLTIHAFFGKIENLNYVKIVKTTKALIKLNESHLIQADGEIIEGIDELKLEIIKSAVKVLY